MERFDFKEIGKNQIPYGRYTELAVKPLLEVGFQAKQENLYRIDNQCIFVVIFHKRNKLYPFFFFSHSIHSETFMEYAIRANMVLRYRDTKINDAQSLSLKELRELWISFKRELLCISSRVIESLIQRLS